VAALLELGIGFHPEYTGRQNVLMAGHILGIPGDRISALMGEIEAFAEIGAYVDQPVRTYSSGMQVRLAFSVATAVRPDILIVDEALSVGDAYFQHKSFDRIRQFRDHGTTLLFVSHSPGAVKTLCDRALLLDRGLVLRDGAPDAVLDYYNALIAAQEAEYQIRQTERAQGRSVTRSGTAEAVIERVALLVDGRPAAIVTACTPATIEISIRVQADLPELTAGIMIRDQFGNDVFGTNTYYQDRPCPALKAGAQVTARFEFPDLALGVGSYSLTIALHTRESHVAANYDWWDRSLVFQVVPGLRPLSTGACNLAVGVRWSEPESTVASGATSAAESAANAGLARSR
jgi:lipopolysaccharide transport system ATP-binding protein